MSCAHENADHILSGERLDPDVDERPSNLSPCEQFRCIDCGAWLSLGPSNDEPFIVRCEINLAEYLAESAESIVPGPIRDAYEDGLISAMIDQVGAYRPQRPRSPIETAVDKACGL